MSQLVPLPPPSLPALIAAAGGRAETPLSGILRLEHSQPAHAPDLCPRASEFLAWCTGKGIASLTALQPLHVATWIEAQTRTLSAPSVKQRALLFDEEALARQEPFAAGIAILFPPGNGQIRRFRLFTPAITGQS